MLFIVIWIVRPTEIPESDVYVCESTYDEGKKMIRRNIPGQGLRKFPQSQLVTPDEIYHFKNQFAPIKVHNGIFSIWKSGKQSFVWIL